MLDREPEFRPAANLALWEHSLEVFLSEAGTVSVQQDVSVGYAGQTLRATFPRKDVEALCLAMSSQSEAIKGGIDPEAVPEVVVDGTAVFSGSKAIYLGTPWPDDGEPQDDAGLPICIELHRVQAVVDALRKAAKQKRRHGHGTAGEANGGAP